MIRGAPRSAGRRIALLRDADVHRLRTRSAGHRRTALETAVRAPIASLHSAGAQCSTAGAHPPRSAAVLLCVRRCAESCTIPPRSSHPHTHTVMGSKKKNKRERPSRREAERQEAASELPHTARTAAPLCARRSLRLRWHPLCTCVCSGKLAKKARHDSHDDQPFMSKRKDGAPPSSSKQMQQMQQKQQQQMRGAGAAGGKGGRPQQQQQQQQQQRAPKQPHPHRPAAGAAAAAASSSSAAASAKPAKAGKKSKQAVPVEEAEEAEPEADESEEPQEFGDDYNADTLDGLKIAFGASGTASGSASAAAAAPNAFRLADQSDSPTDPLRNKAGIEYDSGLTAQRFFEWMIFPLSLESFYENYFEQKPLFIARRDCSAFERQAAVTLVTTTKKLEGLLPREDEPLPWYAPGAGPVPKLTPTSIHDWKTEKNALKTEKVTVVEIESMASRVENREDGSLPAAADTATASSSSAAAAPPPTPGVLPHYYSDWFSIPDIHALLSDPTHNIHYRIDIDITRYKNGVRETLNRQGTHTTSHRAALPNASATTHRAALRGRPTQRTHALGTHPACAVALGLTLFAVASLFSACSPRSRHGRSSSYFPPPTRLFFAFPVPPEILPEALEDVQPPRRVLRDASWSQQLLDSAGHAGIRATLR